MLQNAYSPLTPSNPDVSDRLTSASTAPTAIKPFSTTAYAERLMDDLFQDVEEMLDLAPVPKAAPPAVPDAPSGRLEETVEDVAQPFPGVEVRSTTEPGLVLAPLPAFGELRSLEEDPPAPAPEPAPASEAAVAVSTLQAAQRQLDRLMIAVGCISVVASLALWLLYQEGRQRQMGADPGTISSAPVVSAADIEFSQYLQKSLQQIDASTQKSDTVLLPGSQQPSDRPGTTNNSLPTVTIPKANLPGLPLPATTAPTASPNPTASNSATATAPKLPTNLYPPGSKIAPLPTAPGKKPTAKPTTAPQAAAKPEANPSTIGIPRKLVGVLDQGEQSVALFEINGITQRYELGESIASSGWTLVEVSKNQAVIRRNGEVRSLFVGHSF